MGHLVEACDFLDVLEESAVLKSPVIVELRHGERFTDHVRDVITEEGQDFAVFANHDRIPLHAIADVIRAHPPESTYAGKLGQ